jgi:hypothetical protein
MEKGKYKMIHLSGDAGIECAELLKEIREMIQANEKRKVYNTELVLRGLRAFKVYILREKELQHAIDQHFGQTNIIE